MKENIDIDQQKLRQGRNTRHRGHGVRTGRRLQPKTGAGEIVSTWLQSNGAHGVYTPHKVTQMGADRDNGEGGRKGGVGGGQVAKGTELADGSGVMDLRSCGMVAKCNLVDRD